jgi:hypothetical protein
LGERQRGESENDILQTRKSPIVSPHLARQHNPTRISALFPREQNIYRGCEICAGDVPQVG